MKKVGLIGLKHMGSEHYSNLIDMAAHGRIVLQALCDTDPFAMELPKVTGSLEQIKLVLSNRDSISRKRRLELLHETMQLVCSSPPALYSDYTEMLSSESLDGVIIATPNHLHREMAEATLAKSINTLCEKPLAPTVESCDAMIAAERKSTAFLQVGFHMRYRRLYRYIKDLIDARRLGKIKMIWCQEFRGDWNPEGSKVDNGSGDFINWRYLDSTSGGSLVEKLCHDFDLVSWWLGAQPVRVFAAGGKGVFQDRETIDHADISIEYPDGAKLNISMCMFAPNSRYRGRYMGIIGDEAVLDLDNKLSDVSIYNQNGRVERHQNVEVATRAGAHPGNASAIQLEAFVDSMENGTQPLAGSREGRDSVAVAHAAQRSIREGKVVVL